MLDVCLLGCGGMMPLPRRFLSALLVRYEGHSVLIDCGESTQVALHLSGFSTKQIDHILITHFHGDHISGLPGLLLTIANNHRTEPLHIWGGRGLTRIVKGLTVICESLPYELVIHELPFHEPTEFEALGLRWSTLPLKHRVPCLAYSCELDRAGRFQVERAQAQNIPVKYWSLLQQGQTVETPEGTWQPEDVLGPARRGLKLTYATDGRPHPDFAAFAWQSDLLIAEGLYGSDDKLQDAAKKGHMVYSEAARLAKDAQVNELWLTHFSPAMLDPKADLQVARRIFPNSHAGYNLKKTTLKFKD